MDVYLHLLRLYIKTKMEYRLSFLIHIISMFINYACAFGAIYVLVARFGVLGGWTWPELALLLGFQLLAYSIGAATSFVQFRDMEDMVRRGTFDVLLTKPVSPWGYVVFSGLHIDYAGHIVLALGLMVWALAQLDIAWSPALVIYGVFALVNGCLVVAAVLTMIGASAMVLVQSRAFYSIFFSFWELTRYPLTIFPVAAQWVLFTVVPLAYMNFVPVSVFLGKPVGVIGAAAPVMSLVSGPLSVLVAMAWWRFCLRHYQSGGG